MNITLGSKTFTLDPVKAAAALAGKRVINGRESTFFNLLPLKYPWAYDLYKTMKSNHWEPEDIQMMTDIHHWQSPATTEHERWIIRMGLGYFSAAEGIVGDNVLHVIRECVTAPELKLVLGRHTHEENIHADSLLYMISSLGINPHECEAIFEQIPSVIAKTEFVQGFSRGLRNDLDLTKLENQQAFAKNMFVYGQCMEGTQFYGLFAMILALYRRNRFPGVGNMFRYTLRDEGNHVELLRHLFTDLIAENPGIKTPEFCTDLRKTMGQAVDLELDFISDCLPPGTNLFGLTASDFQSYAKFLANRRLSGVGLEPIYDHGDVSALSFMDEVIVMPKNANFFEKRNTDYQKASALAVGPDDEL